MSGALFKILNLVWLGVWVSIPLSVFLADKQRRRQREAREETVNRATGGSSGSSGSGSSSRWDGTGPVVEAEWVSLDGGEDAKR